MRILPPWVTDWRRRTAQSLIESGVRRGLSGRRILEGLRQRGLGYRTQEFYRDYRWWREVAERGVGMKYLPRDRTIPEHMMIDTIAPWRHEYNVLYELRYLDPQTGRIEKEYLWVGTDEPPTRSVLEDVELPRLLGDSPPESEKVGRELVSYVPLYGVHSLAPRR